MKLVIIVALIIGGLGFFLLQSMEESKLFNPLDKLSEFQKSTAKKFDSEFLAAKVTLEDLGKASEFVGLGEWVNSKPLSLAKLKGKVVLIDFWTFSCINCIRTLPTLKKWHQKYKDSGLVIIGIHTPEFKFENEINNLKEAMREHDIQYAVAQDNDYKTWNAYNNRFWPAEYLIDANGNLRYTHFGEGNYDITEQAIQTLLTDAGYSIQTEDPEDVSSGKQTANVKEIGTPEIYLGYLRINNLGNSMNDIKKDIPYVFQIPKEIKFNQFYLGGKWKIEAEDSEFVGGNGEIGKIVIKYKAARLHMVLSGPKDGSTSEIVLKLDGKVLDPTNKGDHVILKNNQSIVEVDDAKMYNLVNSGDDYGIHTLEIFIIKPGLKAFTFTFG